MDWRLRRKRNLLSKEEVEAIKYLLTLRYNPLRKDIRFPRATADDFVEWEGMQAAIQPALSGIVRQRIGQQEPRHIGVAISGGVDSTTALAMTRKEFPSLQIKTVCIVFGSDDKEAKDAERVSEEFGTTHKTIDIDNPLQDLPKQISIVAEPRWNVYSYYFFEALKACDMIITGDGGDELFGGYPFRYMDLFRKPVLDPETYLNNQRMDWVPDQEKMFGPTINFTWQEIYDTLSVNFNNNLSKLGKVFLADYNGKLVYDYIPTNRAFAEHFNISYFTPMLEPDLLVIERHIPYRFKFDPKNGVGKILLRQFLMERFSFQPAIKQKVGFGMNREEQWNRYKEGIFKHLLLPSEKPLCIEERLINPDWLRRTLIEIDGLEGEIKNRYISRLLCILALEVWLKLKDRSLNPNDKLG